MMISEARRSSCRFKRRARTQAALNTVYRSRQHLQILSSRVRYRAAFFFFFFSPFVFAGYLSYRLTMRALDYPQGERSRPISSAIVKTMTASAGQFFMEY